MEPPDYDNKNRVQALVQSNEFEFVVYIQHGIQNCEYASFRAFVNNSICTSAPIHHSLCLHCLCPGFVRTVYLVIPLPKTPYKHSIYMFWPTLLMPALRHSHSSPPAAFPSPTFPAQLGHLLHASKRHQQSPSTYSSTFCPAAPAPAPTRVPAPAPAPAPAPSTASSCS